MGIAALMLLPAVAADKPPADGAPAGLGQTVKGMDLSGPLEKSLEALGAAGKVQVAADWPALEDVGVVRTTKVTLKVPQATVEQALSLVLAQVSPKGKPLSWYAEGTVVRVTTQAYVLRRHRGPREGGERAEARPARAAPLRRVVFEETPLEDVIGFFRDVSGENFHVNWKALELSGVTKETPVSLNVSNVSIGRALTLVTEQLSAGKDKYESIYWIADADMVRISTGTALNRKLYIRVVDVASLLFIVPDFPGPRISFDTMGKNQTDSTSSSEGGFWKDEEDWDDDEDKDDRRSARERVEQTLIDIVKDSIGPDMWQPQGQGSIRLLHRKLVISQTDLGFKLMEQATRRR